VIGIEPTSAQNGGYGSSTFYQYEHAT